MDIAKKNYLKAFVTSALVSIVIISIVVLTFGDNTAIAISSFCPAGSTDIVVNSQQLGTGGQSNTGLPDTPGGEPPFTLYQYSGSGGAHRVGITSPTTVTPRAYDWTNLKDNPDMGRDHGGDIDLVLGVNKLPHFSPDPNDGGNLRIDNADGRIARDTWRDPPLPANPHQYVADLARNQYQTINFRSGSDELRLQAHSVKDIPNAAGTPYNAQGNPVWTQGDYRKNAGVVHVLICPVPQGIQIVQNVIGGNGNFEYQIFQPPSPTGVADVVVPGGSTSPIVPLNPGTYNIFQSMPSLAWSLTSVNCTSNGVSAGPPNNVSVIAGQTTICTYTNTFNPNARGWLWLNKTVTPPGGTTSPLSFSPTVDGSITFVNQNMVTQTVQWETWMQLPPGNHTIGELDVSSQYTATITGTGCPTTVGGSMNLPPGEFRICTITNEEKPPTADDLRVSSQDYCIQSPTGIVIFSWTYNSPNKYNEKQFQFQVSRNTDFSSILINRVFSNLNNPSPTIHNQSVNVGSVEIVETQANPQQGQMMYGRTYSWRVKEQDNSTGLCSDPDPSWNNTSGLCSGWVPGSSYATPLHAWPTASFTYPNPVNPGTSVPFTNKSTCYNNSGQAVSCVSYVWNFGDGSPTSTATNPNHPYSFVGNYNVNLQANDELNNSCGATKPIKVVPVGSGGSPRYIEKSPFDQ